MAWTYVHATATYIICYSDILSDSDDTFAQVPDAKRAKLDGPRGCRWGAECQTPAENTGWKGNQIRFDTSAKDNEPFRLYMIVWMIFWWKNLHCIGISHDFPIAAFDYQRVILTWWIVRFDVNCQREMQLFHFQCFEWDGKTTFRQHI